MYYLLKVLLNPRTASSSCWHTCRLLLYISVYYIIYLSLYLALNQVKQEIPAAMSLCDSYVMEIGGSNRMTSFTARYTFFGSSLSVTIAEIFMLSESTMCSWYTKKGTKIGMDRSGADRGREL